MNLFLIADSAWKILTSKATLYLVALYALIGLIKWIPDLIQNVKNNIFEARARKTGVEATDHMDGREFEKWLKVQFEIMGYQVRLLPESRDKGGDLLLRDKSRKIIAVQAKKSAKQNIGVKALGEVLRAMKYYNASAGIIVTNRYFTRQMIEETSKHETIELWDRSTLVDELAKAKSVKKYQ